MGIIARQTVKIIPLTGILPASIKISYERQ